MNFQIVDPKLPEYTRIGVDSEKGKQLLATKGNCALDTQLIQKLCPEIKTTRESLTQGFRKLKEMSNGRA
jgi:hypothetical protein